MRILTKIMLLGVMLGSFLVLSMKSYANPAADNGDYGLSCTNTAYGAQHGGRYIDAGNGALGDSSAKTNYGVYVGLDCVYSGAGRTNSSAIVGGEIARAAANAVVGAVSQRLSSAMSMNSHAAANMSYSSNGNGIGMAANHIVGGMSIWTNFSSSTFENDQTYTGVRLDSNNYDADASAMTIGVDKRLGNLIVGLAYTGFDSEIDTTVNSGTIKTEGETLGIYVGLNTGPLSISAGAGTGEYEIDTTRKDLGSLKTITADDITADVTYYHLNISGTVNRGKLSFTPRVAYRNFDLDLPAFTDIVPDDNNTMGDASRTSGFASGVTTDVNVGGKTYSSDMTEAGLAIALSTGKKLTPYIDVAYVSEDTTAAAYQIERTTDGTSAADLAASAPDGYITYGGGLILNLSGKVNGYVSVSETTNREDYNETTISGSLRLKF
ncbi:MAG: hypothetical protein CBB97_05250 [Candidatus Endolissoclinum sp. TMED37]|nr:MAG: hypothetical protein CBB97_05250 [Candidatus Endolissoclinum sp. TMED37]